MDAYSGYNQIPMHRLDEEKTTFIIPMANYYYKVNAIQTKKRGSHVSEIDEQGVCILDWNLYGGVYRRHVSKDRGKWKTTLRP